MEEVKKDYKEFFSNDTTQKFMMVFFSVAILKLLNMIEYNDFILILKWSVAGFWGVNGLDFLTNLKR